MSRFDGRTVLVTGAASGIGFEMASQFRDEGAHVYAADLTPDGSPDGTTALRLDVTDEDAIKNAIATVLDERGQLDVLCSNAGAASTTDPIACTAQEWDQVFAVNARGVFLCAKYALPHMLRQGSGVIVNTASVAGTIGLKDRAAYCGKQGCRDRLHQASCHSVRRHRDPLQLHQPRDGGLTVGWTVVSPGR